MTILAFRRWNVSNIDRLLYPTGVGMGQWAVGRQTAACARTGQLCDCWLCVLQPMGGHATPAPQAGCTCGFYARKLPIGLCRCDHPTKACHQAVGVVRLGGRVIEHERGWRAQYAEIAALVDYTGAVDRSAYPVPFYPDLDAMYGEWAPDIACRDGVDADGIWCSPGQSAAMNVRLQRWQARMQSEWEREREAERRRVLDQVKSWFPDGMAAILRESREARNDPIKFTSVEWLWPRGGAA